MDEKENPKGQQSESRMHSAYGEQSKLQPTRNPAEISGETIDVVGEATGEFPAPTNPAREQTSKSAFMVGAGILISRIIGLIRQRVFAYYYRRAGLRKSLEDLKYFLVGSQIYSLVFEISLFGTTSEGGQGGPISF
jgi:hypothetical protein